MAVPADSRESVIESNIDLLVRAHADVELHHQNALSERSQHLREPGNNDSVVVHQGNTKRLL